MKWARGMPRSLTQRTAVSEPAGTRGRLRPSAHCVTADASERMPGHPAG